MAQIPTQTRFEQFEILLLKYTDEDLEEEYTYQVDRLEMMNNTNIYNHQDKLNTAEMIRLVKQEQERRIIP